MLIMLGTLVLGVSLTSCGAKEQKITYTNENGENVELVLTPTSDDEVVKGALMYASQANYEDVEGLDLGLDASVYFKLDATKSLNGSVAGNLLVSEEGLNLNGSLNYMINGVEEADGSLGNHSLTGSLNGYYDVTDPYVYVDYNSNMDGVVETYKGKELLENLVSQVAPSVPSIPSMPSESVPGESTSDMLTNLDIQQLLYLYKLMMPHSSISISSVNNDEYVISAGLSVNDVLKVVNGNDTYKLSTDVIVNVEVAFSVANGRFLRLSVNCKDAKLLELANLITNPNDRLDFSQSTLELSLTMEIGYGAVTIKKLTSEEKALYID